MADTVFTPADRIRGLNEINEEFSRLLEHAGRALKALSPDAGEEGDDLDARRSTFEENSKSFYIDLQSATAKCKRQAYALEEAGIIPSEAPTATSNVQQAQGSRASGRGGSGTPPGAPTREVERLTNGGLGNLDVGWLNSRGNNVDAEKEAELMEEGKRLLEDVLSRKEDH